MIQIKEVLSNFHPGLTTHLGQTPWENSHIDNSSDVSNPGKHPEENSLNNNDSTQPNSKGRRVSRYLLHAHAEII